MKLSPLIFLTFIFLSTTLQATEVSQYQIKRDLFQHSISTSISKLFIHKANNQQNEITKAIDLVKKVTNAKRKAELKNFIGKKGDMPLVAKVRQGKYSARLYGVTIEMDLHGFFHNRITINGIPYAFNSNDSVEKRASDLKLLFLKEMKMPKKKKMSFHWSDLFISNAFALFDFFGEDTPEYCGDYETNHSVSQIRECMAQILTVNAEGIVAIKVDFYDRDRVEEYNYLLNALQARLHSEDAQVCGSLTNMNHQDSHRNLSDDTEKILIKLAASDTEGDNMEITETEAVRAIFGNLAHRNADSENTESGAKTCQEFIGGSIVVGMNTDYKMKTRAICAKIQSMANQCNALVQKHKRRINISRKYATEYDDPAAADAPLADTFGDGAGGALR